jgi:hypothetical protein
MEDIMAEKTVDEIVDLAKKPGIFKIIDAIKERAYPEDDIVIYLDEKAAYLASQVQEKIDELGKKRSSDSIEAELEKLYSKRDVFVKSMNASKYVFTMVGISEGRREDLLKEAIAEYPIEYTDENNVFTNERKKVEVENPDRDRMFTNLLWRDYVMKITSPDGDIQEGLALEEIEELRRSLPIASIGKINEALEKLRVASAVFMMNTDEDFLAKS